MPNPPALSPPKTPAPRRSPRSVLTWPAWLRVVVLLPALALLWLAVLWANQKAAPW